MKSGHCDIAKMAWQQLVFVSAWESDGEARGILNRLPVKMAFCTLNSSCCLFFQHGGWYFSWHLDIWDGTCFQNLQDNVTAFTPTLPNRVSFLMIFLFFLVDCIAIQICNGIETTVIIFLQMKDMRIWYYDSRQLTCRSFSCVYEQEFVIFLRHFRVPVLPNLSFTFFGYMIQSKP